MTYYKRFYHGVRWNFVGSILYEGLKAAHQIFLISTISTISYGKIGTTFSIIYFCMNIANAGAATTIPPFLKSFTKNKQSFVWIFGVYTLIQAAILSLTSFIIHLFFNNYLLSNKELFILIPLLIIVTEGIRAIFRSLLHTLFFNKVTVAIESSLIILYLGLVWAPYLLFKTSITLNSIFIPYLFTSVVAVVLFILIIVRFYKTLPSGEIENGVVRRIVKARFYNYSTRITKNVFTGNFLVPLFAMRFGFEQAGIFKLASYLSDSIKGILNSTVGFSSGALLANLKNSNLKEKQNAFSIISEKLNKIICFISIFFLFNFKSLIELKTTIYQTHSIILFTSFFLLTAILENFFIIYDQLYIVEELSDRLFAFKILELTLFYIAIILGNTFLPSITLLSLMFVRSLTFIIIATHSYRLWGVLPSFKFDLKFISVCCFISLLSYYLRLI